MKAPKLCLLLHTESTTSRRLGPWEQNTTRGHTKGVCLETIAFLDCCTSPPMDIESNKYREAENIFRRLHSYISSGHIHRRLDPDVDYLIYKPWRIGSRHPPRYDLKLDPHGYKGIYYSRSETNLLSCLSRGPYLHCRRQHFTSDTPFSFTGSLVLADISPKHGKVHKHLYKKSSFPWSRLPWKVRD